MIDTATYTSAYLSLYPFTCKLLRTWDRSLSYEQAEDLAQETWTRIWRGRALYRGECSIKTWAFLIARRTLSKAQYRLLSHPDALHELAEDDGEYSYEPGLDPPIHAAQILARCTSRDRAILVEVYARGVTHEEYAGAVGSAVGTIRRRTWEARKAAREAAA